MESKLLISRKNDNDDPYRIHRNEDTPEPINPMIIADKVYEIAEGIKKLVRTKKYEAIIAGYREIEAILGINSTTLFDLRNIVKSFREYEFYRTGKVDGRIDGIVSCFDSIVEIFFELKPRLLKIDRTIESISFVNLFQWLEYSEYGIITKKRERSEYYFKSVEWTGDEEVLKKHMRALRANHIIYCDRIQDVLDGIEIPVIKCENPVSVVVAIFEAWEEYKLIDKRSRKGKNSRIIKSFNYLKNNRTSEFSNANLDNCRANLPDEIQFKIRRILFP